MVADDVLFDLSGNFMGRTSTIRLSTQKDSWSMGVDESLWFLFTSVVECCLSTK
jgi:hypothetical protein